ncbi:TrbC/VirB2 family protein [Rhizobium sp.]|uniref:TrbC/VirB2 family protein n=1 Tax=Rhizobium sp. TaxID=391 RepID=UPI00289C4D69
MSRKLLTFLGFAAVSMMMIEPAFAGGGGGLPWEGPLEQIQESITGPVAMAIALIAVAVAGGMLIFGGEINDFARRLAYVVLVCGILIGGAQIVALFGGGGSSIGIPLEAQQTVTLDKAHG